MLIDPLKEIVMMIMNFIIQLTLRKPSRELYVDDIEINTLGINYYVNRMLSQIALIHFMSLKCNTFAKTTFEFFLI